jgi:hypothetical protein
MSEDDWRPRIDSKWWGVVDAFIAAGSEGAVFRADGSWSIESELDVGPGMLLRGFPGEFVAFWDGYIPLEDHAGEVGEEMSYRVETTDDHLAVLTTSSHWQAGDTVHLFVGVSPEAYSLARAETVAELRAEISAAAGIDDPSIDEEH